MREKMMKAERMCVLLTFCGDFRKLEEMGWERWRDGWAYGFLSVSSKTRLLSCEPKACICSAKQNEVDVVATMLAEGLLKDVSHDPSKLKKQTAAKRSAAEKKKSKEDEDDKAKHNR